MTRPAGDASRDARPQPGAFPFAISDGPKESGYLTWVRNHANYMALRGLTDYSRAVGVLVRGMLVNFLILMPYLLVLGVLVGGARLLGWPPYLLTKALLVLFGLWILLFPVATPLSRIVRFERTRKTGSDSSVAVRDRYERSFGGFLLAILAAAVLESLPARLDLLHSEINWPTLASTIAAGTVVLAVSRRILTVLGKGLTRRVALVAVGAVGIVVPLLFVMATAHFLVFGQPRDLTLWLALAAYIFPAMILVAIGMGALLGAFKKVDARGLAGLTVTSVAILVGGRQADVRAYRYVTEGDALLEAATAQIHEDTAVVAAMSEHMAAGPGPLATVVIEGLGTGAVTERRPESLRGLAEELARAAEAAGLYAEDVGEAPEADAQPGFADVARAVDLGIVEACEGADGRTEECESLEREVTHLLGRVTTLAGAYEARSSPQRLVRYLISMPKQELEALRDPAYDELYPGLITLADEQGALDQFLGRVDDLAIWGDWFRDVQHEVAATASILPIHSGFFETDEARAVRTNAFWPKVFFVLVLALQLWFFCFLTVDVNLTSIHRLYRDRLASAFLVGEDADGRIGIERDLDLMEICQYEEQSTAPYHLINAALNLQGSKDIVVRDRSSDFFIFSKRFTGGERTGYCRSENLERVFPQVGLATAMAISAAAASPNMGRATNPALVAVMSLLNIRLGYWLPNPGLVEQWLSGGEAKRLPGETGGFSFDRVFAEEMLEIEKRWTNQYPAGSERAPAVDEGGRTRLEPTPEHGLVGLGFSGGGIRSATLNLGIAQALDRAGAFAHVDYMSTVSGGGYLGSSISALMRRRDGDSGHAAETAGEESRESGDDPRSSAGQLFAWRVRPAALVKELLGRLDETSRWVNVSDGGHIENLAGIELLRRRCGYVILCDAEADPEHHFHGLATLIRTARVDLGVHIDINVDRLRLEEKRRSRDHWAIGTIRYPKEEKNGLLLYLKSSITGDEDEVVNQYRSTSESFPHESTADQFFAEGQFEAYRGLGQHIGEKVLQVATGETETAARAPARNMSFAEFEQWFQALLGRPSHTDSPEASQPPAARAGEAARPGRVTPLEGVSGAG